MRAMRCLLHWYLGTAQVKMAFAPQTIGVTVYCNSHWAGVAINTWCAGDEIQPCQPSVCYSNSGLAPCHFVGHEAAASLSWGSCTLLVGRVGAQHGLLVLLTQRLPAGSCPQAGPMNTTWSWGASCTITARRGCSAWTAPRNTSTASRSPHRRCVVGLLCSLKSA